MKATDITADLLRGALELERTVDGVLPHRLPAWVVDQCADQQLTAAERQPSGVRLVFRSRATVVELDTLRTTMNFRGARPRPDGVYDLLVDGELTGQASVTGGNAVLVDPATGQVEMRTGPVGIVRFAGLPDRLKDVEIWLPHNETTRLVELRTDEPVDPVPPGDRRIWLHYGSSISQGSVAASPSTTWPALAAAAGGVDLINIGLSGSALLDPCVARVLRDTAADLISIKIGINLVNLDIMRLRAFTVAVHGFLDTVRDGHATTPLVVVSPILCPIHEDTPGPGAPDFDPETGVMRFRATGDPADIASGKLTLRVIRDELARIVGQRQADDPNLHYLDGLSLYGEADFAELPLPDRLHPDAATHRRIGDRFAAQVFGVGGPFARR